MNLILTFSLPSSSRMATKLSLIRVSYSLNVWICLAPFPCCVLDLLSPIPLLCTGSAEPHSHAVYWICSAPFPCCTLDLLNPIPMHAVHWTCLTPFPCCTPLHYWGDPVVITSFLVSLSTHIRRAAIAKRTTIVRTANQHWYMLLW